MKTRSLGLSFITLAFSAMGLMTFAAWRPGIGAMATGIVLATGIGELAVGVALWRRSALSARLYAGWLAVYGVGGGALQLAGGSDPVNVLIWLALMLALFGAVGFYVRSEMRRLLPRGAASPLPAP